MLSLIIAVVHCRGVRDLTLLIPTKASLAYAYGFKRSRLCQKIRQEMTSSKQDAS
jgi:hypothetical protein